MAVTVVLANDFELVLEGLAAMLAPHPEVRVVELAVDRLPQRAADVALFDTFGASHTAVERLRALVQDGRARRVAVFSFDHRPEYIQRMLDLGADGYLSKTLDGSRLAGSLVRIAAGERVIALEGPRRRRTAPALGVALGLTPRECEVAALVIAGETNAEIADSLGISPATVKVHLRSTFAKLGVANRTSLAIRLLAEDSFRRSDVATGRAEP